MFLKGEGLVSLEIAQGGGAANIIYLDRSGIPVDNTKIPPKPLYLTLRGSIYPH